ncbi:hypothetical protein Bbelb_177040 [Branchiostoma belcheri]|nr:hypothetical protein Bbelb_177040 [Branchiostoma belcheri]
MEGGALCAFRPGVFQLWTCQSGTPTRWTGVVRLRTCNGRSCVSVRSGTRLQPLQSADENVLPGEADRTEVTVMDCTFPGQLTGPRCNPGDARSQGFLRLLTGPLGWPYNTSFGAILRWLIEAPRCALSGKKALRGLVSQTVAPCLPQRSLDDTRCTPLTTPLPRDRTMCAKIDLFFLPERPGPDKLVMGGIPPLASSIVTPYISLNDNRLMVQQ